MAGITKWEKEKIQTIKESTGVDSEDEQFIDQLVEADMQRTSLSLSQNPPVLFTLRPQPTTQLKEEKEPRDPRLRKQKLPSNYPKHGKEKGTKRRKHPGTEERKKEREPNDHYPLKEQKKGAWYTIFSTPRAPQRTPPQ